MLRPESKAERKVLRLSGGGARLELLWASLHRHEGDENYAVTRLAVLMNYLPELTFQLSCSRFNENKLHRQSSVVALNSWAFSSTPRIQGDCEWKMRCRCSGIRFPASTALHWSEAKPRWSPAVSQRTSDEVHCTNSYLDSASFLFLLTRSVSEKTSCGDCLAYASG